MELSEIREKIDTVDDQLLKLFLERMSLAEEVAAYKNEQDVYKRQPRSGRTGCPPESESSKHIRHLFHKEIGRASCRERV